MHSSLLSAAMIDDLVARAEVSPRLRQHQNIHASYTDLCQRFFNAMCRESYIAPHRHSGASDEETLVAIRGSFMAVLFDDSGGIDRVIRCGAASEHVGAVIPVGCWHTVVPLTEIMVMLEVKAGPFDPSRAKEFAAWAPVEGDAAVGDYRKQLEERCAAWLAAETASAGPFIEVDRTSRSNGVAAPEGR